MSVAQFIQNAWNKQAKWLIVLRPLSLLYQSISLLNKKLYRTGIKPTYTSPVPVMVIGNITVGGSGKTPLLIQLVNYLDKHGVKVAVISRGYGGKGPFPAYVDFDSTPESVGDEPCLIVQSTGVPMAVGANRQKAIELLLAKHQLDLIISDDGLQHYALNRQLEWIVLDQHRGLGNARLLPEGYLRESPERLKTATVIEHSTSPATDLHMYLAVTQPYLLNEIQDFDFNPQQNFYALVGIGFPQRFYRTLESIGVKQFQCYEFPDHHDYELEDLDFDDVGPIITTEKDAVKLLHLLKEHPDYKREIWVVPVEAILSKQCYTLLDHQLEQLGVRVTKENL
ncbi:MULTISPECIES: tetraacyldisaccharide 4'-kinase [unclassified Acinetobacter]|uniref:tetraacyldisaccharide 4'-kinase n=1 Tax=unclassified Acinetobacter TaxID=196816 RepID=UPI0029348DF6|nr:MULTISPECIES: tetraacyldisaccharide 4'-kinase [unclassified Acinetobacter]WOE33056.1 tetraacyldisaccharide 4'-kinase [Acinetobacter sp. SAAs470]WOE39887.1 tetraacyldisaccharide 4'-kinase [Acinetobacter sp. SAAs474]